MRRMRGGVAATRDGVELYVRLPDEAARELRFLQTWYSPSYGVRQPAVAAVCEGDEFLPMESEFQIQFRMSGAARSIRGA